MKIHYLEIVSHDVNGVCKAYESTYSANFSKSEPLLGGAKTCKLPDGSILGIREPLRDNEEPVVRPYWLVENMEQAVANLEAEGAEIAVAPTEIPGKGVFAIYLLGSNEHGLWQV